MSPSNPPRYILHCPQLPGTFFFFPHRQHLGWEISKDLVILMSQRTIKGCVTVWKESLVVKNYQQNPQLPPAVWTFRKFQVSAMLLYCFGSLIAYFFIVYCYYFFHKSSNNPLHTTCSAPNGRQKRRETSCWMQHSVHQLKSQIFPSGFAEKKIRAKRKEELN